MIPLSRCNRFAAVCLPADAGKAMFPFDTDRQQPEADLATVRRTQRLRQVAITLNCELCKGGHHEEKIILCDRCDRGCHLFCLSPPLEQVPEGEWLCPMCKAEEAHGFVEGQQYSLDEFEKTATSFKKGFFGGQAAAKKVRNDAWC